MRRLKLIFSLAVLLGCAVPASAQTPDDDTALYGERDIAGYADADPATAPERIIIYNSATPDESEWQQVTAEKAYSYRDKREYVVKPEQPPEIPGWYRFLIGVVEFLTSAAGKAMLWIVLALIVGYIVYRVLAGQGALLFGRHDRSAPEPEAEGGRISEEGLLGHNWEERLRTALAGGDTRLAIRYSYMHLLQALQERGLIAYRPDKTNTEYYRELTEGMRQPFRTISRQYEYAWYGELIPGPEAMDSYLKTYEGLKKSISYA